MNERHLIALRLRAEGATFKAIGEALGVGAQRARHIFQEADRKQNRQFAVDEARINAENAIKIRAALSILKTTERHGPLNLGHYRKAVLQLEWWLERLAQT